MATHTLTIEVTAEITDPDALVEHVRSETPDDSLSPDDIRDDQRAAASLLAGVSKAVRELEIPGVSISDAKVTAGGD